MATVELSMEVAAYLDEEGVGVSVYIGEDEEGNGVTIKWDDLFDDLINSTDVDNDPEDRKYVEAVATALADLSKDLFCRIG